MATSEDALIELAREYGSYRGGRTSHLAPGQITLRLTGSIASFILGTAALVVSILWPEPWALWLACRGAGAALLIVGAVGAARYLGQPAFERVARGVEILGRVAGTVMALVALVICGFSLSLLLARGTASQDVATAAVALVFAALGTLLIGTLGDVSGAILRGDRRPSAAWDSKLRTLLFWLSLVALLWLVLQLAYRVGTLLHVDGPFEIVLILAVPLVFGYVVHIRDTRTRLGELALQFGELASVAEAAAPANSSRLSKAELRIQLHRLQVRLHADNSVRLAGLPIRPLIDDDLVDLVDIAGEALAGVERPFSARGRPARVKWLEAEVKTRASVAALATLAWELRRRALVATGRF